MAGKNAGLTVALTVEGASGGVVEEGCGSLVELLNVGSGITVISAVWQAASRVTRISMPDQGTLRLDRNDSFWESFAMGGIAIGEMCAC